MSNHFELDKVLQGVGCAKLCFKLGKFVQKLLVIETRNSVQKCSLLLRDFQAICTMLYDINSTGNIMLKSLGKH